MNGPGIMVNRRGGGSGKVEPHFCLVGHAFQQRKSHAVTLRLQCATARGGLPEGPTSEARILYISVCTPVHRSKTPSTLGRWVSRGRTVK